MADYLSSHPTLHWCVISLIIYLFIARKSRSMGFGFQILTIYTSYILSGCRRRIGMATTLNIKTNEEQNGRGRLIHRTQINRTLQIGNF